MYPLIKNGETKSWSIGGAKVLLGISSSKKESIVVDEVELERFVPVDDRITDTIRVDAINTAPSAKYKGTSNIF